MATDLFLFLTGLFLEMAELPATGSLGTGQLDTRDLLVAGVPISISSKYLYLYLALKVLTKWNAKHQLAFTLTIRLVSDTILKHNEILN